MHENSNQPRNSDAVLGSQTPPERGSAILGGIEGVLHRLTSPIVEQRIAALKEAIEYGQDGLDLATMCLQDESEQVQRAAYSLLRTKAEDRVKQALREYKAYEFFECLYTLEGHSASVRSVAITLDGKTFISGSKDGKIKEWDIETGERKRTIMHPSSPYPYYLGDIYSVAISPDGKTIFIQEDCDCGGWGGFLALDSKTGKLKQRIRRIGGAGGLPTYVFCLAVSPDGKTAVCDGDGIIKIWDIETGECKRTLVGHSPYLNSAAITPDGKTIVGGGDERAIKMWDMETGKCKRTLEWYSPWVSVDAITPDGKTIVARAESIKLLDIETGECKRTLETGSHQVCSFAISSDSLTLVTGGSDNTIKVWDIETGEVHCTLEGHSGEVHSVAITPNRKTLVSGSEDKTIKVWGVG